MVRIVNEEHMKRCVNCGKLLEYSSKDVQRRVVGSRKGKEILNCYIVCPVCEWIVILHSGEMED